MESASGPAASGHGGRADARRNRQRIFIAAKACFAEQGGGASMEDIARRAGVGVGTLYRAFASRAGLAETIYRETLDELVAAAEQFANGLDPWTALTKWLTAYVTEMSAKRSMLSDLQPLFDKDPALLAEARAKAVGALQTVLSRAQHAGVARQDVLAFDLIPLLNGAVPSPASNPVHAYALLDIILVGLRA